MIKFNLILDNHNLICFNYTFHKSRYHRFIHLFSVMKYVYEKQLKRKFKRIKRENFIKFIIIIINYYYYI